VWTRAANGVIADGCLLLGVQSGNRTEFAEAQRIIANEWRSLSTEERREWEYRAGIAKEEWRADLASLGLTPEDVAAAAAASRAAKPASAAPKKKRATSTSTVTVTQRAEPVPSMSLSFAEELDLIEARVDPSRRALVHSIRMKLQAEAEAHISDRLRESALKRSLDSEAKRLKDIRKLRARAVKQVLPTDSVLATFIDQTIIPAVLGSKSATYTPSSLGGGSVTLRPDDSLFDPAQPLLTTNALDVAQQATMLLSTSRIRPTKSLPAFKTDLGCDQKVFAKLIMAWTFIRELVSDRDSDGGVAAAAAGQALVMRVAGKAAAQGVSAPALMGLLAVGPEACGAGLGEGLHENDGLALGEDVGALRASVGEMEAAGGRALAPSEPPPGDESDGPSRPAPGSVASLASGAFDAPSVAHSVPVNPGNVGFGHFLLCLEHAGTSYRCLRMLNRIHIALLRVILEDISFSNTGASGGLEDDDEEEGDAGSGHVLPPTLDMLTPLTWPAVLRLLVHPEGDAMAQRLRAIASPAALDAIARLRDVEYAKLSQGRKTSILLFLIDAATSTGRMRALFDARLRAAGAILRAKNAEDEKAAKRFQAAVHRVQDHHSKRREPWLKRLMALTAQSVGMEVTAAAPVVAAPVEDEATASESEEGEGDAKSPRDAVSDAKTRRLIELQLAAAARRRDEASLVTAIAEAKSSGLGFETGRGRTTKPDLHLASALVALSEIQECNALSELRDSHSDKCLSRDKRYTLLLSRLMVRSRVLGYLRDGTRVMLLSPDPTRLYLVNDPRVPVEAYATVCSKASDALMTMLADEAAEVGQEDGPSTAADKKVSNKSLPPVERLPPLIKARVDADTTKLTGVAALALGRSIDPAVLGASSVRVEGVEMPSAVWRYLDRIEDVQQLLDSLDRRIMCEAKLFAEIARYASLLEKTIPSAVEIRSGKFRDGIGGAGSDGPSSLHEGEDDGARGAEDDEPEEGGVVEEAGVSSALLAQFEEEDAATGIAQRRSRRAAAEVASRRLAGEPDATAESTEEEGEDENVGQEEDEDDEETDEEEEEEDDEEEEVRRQPARVAAAKGRGVVVEEEEVRAGQSGGPSDFAQRMEVLRAQARGRLAGAGDGWTGLDASLSSVAQFEALRSQLHAWVDSLDRYVANPKLALEEDGGVEGVSTAAVTSAAAFVANEAAAATVRMEVAGHVPEWRLMIRNATSVSHLRETLMGLEATLYAVQRSRRLERQRAENESRRARAAANQGAEEGGGGENEGEEEEDVGDDPATGWSDGDEEEEGEEEEAEEAARGEDVGGEDEDEDEDEEEEDEEEEDEEEAKDTEAGSLWPQRSQRRRWRRRCATSKALHSVAISFRLLEMAVATARLGPKPLALEPRRWRRRKDRKWSRAAK
jgi:hypothetical protein